MSRGLGHVQRTILALIQAEPHGAWTVVEICRRVYPDVDGAEKKHSVAVLRAVKRMKLPGDWTLYKGGISQWEKRLCLFDWCDDESRMRARRASGGWEGRFESWKERWPHAAADTVERAAAGREYRDASPIKKLDDDIAEYQRRLSLLAMAGASCKSTSAHISTLKAERDRHAAEAAS